MGADLYRNSIIEPARKRHESGFMDAVKNRNAAPDAAAELIAQTAVDAAYEAMHPPLGYFRDNYNSLGLACNLSPGWSWWRDVIPLLDADDNLSGDKLTAFRAMVERSQVQSAEHYAATCGIVNDNWSACAGFESKPECRKGEYWVKAFTEDRAELLRFLDAAIRDGDSIHASL